MDEILIRVEGEEKEGNGKGEGTYVCFVAARRGTQMCISSRVLVLVLVFSNVFSIVLEGATSGGGR